MITPILLCCSPGTRPWPLARKSYTKRFGSLGGGTILRQLQVR